jgi:small subunit ribosomal protein S17
MATLRAICTASSRGIVRCGATWNTTTSRTAASITTSTTTSSFADVNNNKKAWRTTVLTRGFAAASSGGGGGDDNGSDNDGTSNTNNDISSSPVQDVSYNSSAVTRDFKDTSYFDNDDMEALSMNMPAVLSQMTNDELNDTSSIPGWELIHSPPGKLPKGALVGMVVSTKMQKTVNVAVDRYKIAPIYQKRLRYTRKFMAHDETEVANMGDLVMIVPCHRLSRHKHFLLREIIRPKGQL